MKHLLSSACCLAINLTLPAAVPADWEVDLAAQPPQVFTLQRPRGETYELKAVLNRHGKPFEPAITNACIYWQTNGMENLYWSAPASVSNNVLRATWTPSMDPGATTVRGYIGDPGHIYAAAFQFRFIASPGALPNALPLPTPVIDFARVRVLNPPWSGGGGGGVDTNAVRDIVRDVLATNGIRSVDGAARPLPKYLHLYEAADSYPAEAAEYYAYRQGAGAVPAPQCSAVRSGGYLCRNFDFPFDDRAEFVVHMSSGPARFASVGVAQVGTNLTEAIVTSGKPEYSHLYKWLPGATVDGINENGVVAEINVVDGNPQTSGWHNDTGNLHPLAAIRWILDNATNAQHAAEYIASHIAFPAGWTQNFHYMVADERETWIVENGGAIMIRGYGPEVLTNFTLIIPEYKAGPGSERFDLLANGASITNAWYTRAYRSDTTPPWVSEFGGDLAALALATNYWARAKKEAHRGESFNGTNWWQTVHTSIYDISNRVLRVAVQETDDWYTFAIQSGSGAPPLDAYTRAETDALLAEKADATATATALSTLSSSVSGLQSSVSGLQSSKADRSALSEYMPIGGTSSTVNFGDLYSQMLGIYSNEYGSYFYVSPGLGAFYSKDGLAYFFRPEDEIATHADIPVIDATDPTFSNEVATVARTVTPQPSPTLRVYDEVRQCYWLGKMVNGVIQWEVE